MEDIEVEITAHTQIKAKRDDLSPNDYADIDVPGRSESLRYFTQYRQLKNGSTLFTPHQLLTACTLFALDFPDDIPEDLYDEAIAENPTVVAKNGIINELYTDLLEARAEGDLEEFLEEIREFVEEGA